MGKMARHSKTQPLFLQMRLHEVDCICTVNSEQANDSFLLYIRYSPSTNMF